MSDAEAADLYRQLVALPLVVVLVLAVVTTALHVLAIHGRRVIPERPARVVGWLLFGLIVGLVTQPIEVRPMLGSTGSRLRDPGTVGMVAVILIIGIAIFMLLPALAELVGGGR